MNMLKKEFDRNYDLKIARKAKLKTIFEIAKKIGINRNELEQYGDYKAKIKLDIVDRIKKRPLGKYIAVTAMTPTPLGEGKTLTTIGLSQGLWNIGKKAICCIRQPSLGPVFGVKGGASGGGYAQVVPMDDFNLHLTGDAYMIASAHNLLAAFIDNSIYYGNKLGIDPKSVGFKRVVDINDRALRKIIVGVDGKANKFSRESGFDITAASEVMAIVSLSKNIKDMRRRLDKIVIGFSYNKKPITAKDLKVSGAMAVLLKDAIKPNILQTLENTPVFVHTGPFGNIAHGNSSIIADDIALHLADYVVTETGFGADCGLEKFFDIKSRYSGLNPDAVVIVCSIRALKVHSGKYHVVAGRPFPLGLDEEDMPALEKGCANLRKHIENIKLFGVPCVVAVNRFSSDTEKEISYVLQKSKLFGADDSVVNDSWRNGGKGASSLARSVVKLSCEKNSFKYLYPLKMSIREKIFKIATSIYGAKDVKYYKVCQQKIDLYEKLGFGNLPICMAKTHLSLSHDSNIKGAPSGYTLPIYDIRLSAGAGYLYPMCGHIRTMPGLPEKPAAIYMDVDARGNITGLF